MKKILLFALALSVGLLTYAQSGSFEKMSTKAPEMATIEKVGVKAGPITNATKSKASQSFTKGGRDLTFIHIGSSGNAYGFYGDPRTYLWADPSINSVVFTHRMIVDPPTSYGNSRVAYDVSWDGGADGTWTNNIQVYDPLGPDPGTGYPLAAGRYPQGAIINPEGNTDPANAYYTYFIATLDNTNSNWGGYGYGVNALTEVDPPAPTQQNATSGGDYWRLIPDAFTVTQQGTAWMADINYQGAYLGQYIFNKGVINEETNDIEYEEWLMDILAADDGINDSKIAFSPDGQTGYLLVMSDAASDPQEFSNYHPILYATTDGGETWSDEPNHCLLGGPDGIENVKQFVSDEVMEAIYGAGFDREAIPYNMGFHAGLAVDDYGTAHITGIIACASDDGWYPNYESMGTFHVWYHPETETWDAELLYMNKTFDGDMGGISMYNRPYVSTCYDGHTVFFSFIDTDQEGVTDNVSPDIYATYYDVYSGTYGEVANVTSFTQAMWTAYWGSQSHYVFEEITATDRVYTVPFVYEEADPADPAAQVEFWYLDGFTFTIPVTGIEDNKTLITNVAQNFPNPFSTTTNIEVSLESSANLSIEVTNLLGQLVFADSKGLVDAGSHNFVVSAANLDKGVYFYTVKANNSLVTKKMIVE